MTKPTGRPPGRPITRPHGTVAGYRRHQRDGSPFCGPCRTAWSIHQRTMYLNRQARKKAATP